MKKNSIIWAMDPSQSAQEAKELVAELRAWSKKLKVEVQPVTLFSDGASLLPAEGAHIWTRGELKKFFRDVSDAYRKKTKTEDFLPVEILVTTSFSRRAMANDLARLAERSKAVMVFANTRAQKTWNPFRLGGFVEALVATCRVPMLLMNPKAKASEKISSILFPTDFSVEAKNALVQLMPWAHAFNSKIALFNQVEAPFVEGHESLFLNQRVLYKKLMNDIEVERKTKAAGLNDFLEKHDLGSTSVVSKQKKYLSQDIIDTSVSKKVNLIALVSRSGPLTQALIGGVPRDVLLSAKCPVIIFFRPKALKQKPKTQAKKEKAPRSFPLTPLNRPSSITGPVIV